MIPFIAVKWTIERWKIFLCVDNIEILVLLFHECKRSAWSRRFGRQ